MLYTFLLLLGASLYLLYKYLNRNHNYWKKKNINYIKPIPFFGNFLEVALFKIDIGTYLAKLYNSVKDPFFGIYIFNKPVLVLRDPELIKTILVKDFNNFNDRTIASCEHDPIPNNMLFLSKNPDWKVSRKPLTPVFTSGKLKSMYPLINGIGEELNKYIRSNLHKGTMEAKEICSQYSTDLIAKCAFGINAHSLDRPDKAEFRKMGKKMFDFSWRNGISQISYFFLEDLVKIFKLKFVPADVTKFMDKVFWDSLKIREKAKETGNDIIGCLMEMNKHGIFNNVDDYRLKGVAAAGQFYLAGFETTSATMAFTLYELCINPDIQEKVRNDIKACINKHNGITYEAIQDMKYLQLCIEETLRMYPVLPFLDRRCNSDYTLPGTNMVIEKGTAVYIPMFGLHYDPKYFHDPKKYIPERFTEENRKKITNFSYIPFGEGPRYCIGARFGLLGAKTGLAHILSEFEVVRNAETPVPLVYETKTFVLASKVGLPMKFKRSVISAA